MVEIFKNSINLHNAKYSNYIGDRDSKTFSNITEEKPYSEFLKNKLECVLHVGKRMFRHLKDAKKTLLERKKIKKAAEKKRRKSKTRRNK